MIDFNKAKYFTEPYNYFEIENVFDKDTFEKLIADFPDVSDTEVVMGGRRTSWKKEDEDILQKSKVWKSFYDFLNRQKMLDFIVNKYSSDLKKWDSNINANTSMKDDCFTWIDWSMAEDGYVREPHCDSDPRFWNFIIFLNDKDWEGGDFVIHSSEKINFFKKSFWVKKLPVSKRVEAKKNFGVFFLSTPNSYHSVSKQFNTKTPRKFIYGSISLKGKTFNKLYVDNPNYFKVVLEYLDETPELLRKIGRKIKRLFATNKTKKKMHQEY